MFIRTLHYVNELFTITIIYIGVHENASLSYLRTPKNLSAFGEIRDGFIFVAIMYWLEAAVGL